MYDNNTYISEYIYIGTVECDDSDDGYVIFEQKNKFLKGEEIEIMKPSGENIFVTVEDIKNDEGLHQDSAPHARQRLHVKFSQKPDPNDILRRKNNEN